MDDVNGSPARPDFAAEKRYVRVVPPTVHAGVGNALREAFRMDPETRSLNGFEDLLRRLD